MKSKIHLTVTVLFLTLIFGLGIAFWVIPDRAFSPQENRSLHTLPDLSPSQWLDGQGASRLVQYYSDQFPLREAWVELHALGELGGLKGESNGVLVGREGQLAVRRFDAYLSRLQRWEDTDYYSTTHVEKGLKALAALDKTLAGQGVPLCVLLPPRTIDVTAEDFSYPSVLSDRLEETIQATLQAEGVQSVELLETFRRLHREGEYVYYRTDHHWTTRGAYEAYTTILKTWGMEEDILPPSAFRIRTIPDFYGTTHARAGLSFLPPDTLELWETEDDSLYTVLEGTEEDSRVVIASGFIQEARLTERDKYAAFLDGTHDRLFIRRKDTQEPRPRLLLARDSFANSLVPFLAHHFDILLINLTGNTDQSHLSALCEEYGCQRVLVVCNRENLITSPCLTLLH